MLISNIISEESIAWRTIYLHRTEEGSILSLEDSFYGTHIANRIDVKQLLENSERDEGEQHDLYDRCKAREEFCCRPIALYGLSIEIRSRVFHKYCCFPDLQ